MAVRVLVAGAAGMLGTDVVPAVLRRGHEVAALPREELDITDSRAVDAAVAEIEPEVVVNCAAWTDVDGAEANEAGAMRVNDEGAALLAAAAARAGASYVLISTDYVFDGTKRRPYLESDMTNPISAYGRTKLGGEVSASIANPRHFIVRSSWLFGVSGRNFVETMLGLAEREQDIIVVNDQTGCPTYTPHLAAAIAELIETDEYGIHHVAASGQCTWFDFAQEIFDQSGIEVNVMAGTTEMLARPAPRPAYSVLRSERRGAFELPEWRRGLADYLRQRAATEQAVGS